MTKKASTPIERAGRNITKIDVQGSYNAVANDGATAIVQISPAEQAEWESWRKRMEREIKALKGLTTEDKKMLNQNVAQVVQEAQKGKEADPGRIQRLLNTLNAMAPDILDVVIATIANPLAGLGLVAKKIAQKAQVTRAA
jgi:hypothetical protein